MVQDRRKTEELHQRLIQFAARTSRVAKALPRSDEGRYISQQLLRCGLSAPANYAEARGAESRADFIHKLRVVLKELNEAKSWLEQIVANGLFGERRCVHLSRKTKNSAGLLRRQSGQHGHLQAGRVQFKISNSRL